MQRMAQFSSCRRYRYALWRYWDRSLPEVLFIGLNPSLADETRDDPTIRRCIRFARDWGYGGLCVVNLFAWCATDPADLLKSAKPIGPGNDHWIDKQAARVDLRIAAWGNHGQWQDRAAAVLARWPDLHCLKQNRNGQPAHPLYLPATSSPIAYHQRGIWLSVFESGR